MVRVRKEPLLSTDKFDRAGEFFFDGEWPSLREWADSGLAVMALTISSGVLSIGKWTGMATRMGVLGEEESELSTGELWPVAVVSADTVERLVQMDLGESEMLSS